MSENLFGKSLSELETIVIKVGGKKYNAKQIAEWMYQKNCSDFLQMSNIAKDFRENLSKNFAIEKLEVKKIRSSNDGTKKYLFSKTKNIEDSVESVFIPEETWAALCISTQYGCKMACKFCLTGRMHYHGNLSTGEIISQYSQLPEKDLVSSLVFMGMGEPMDNLDNLLSSIEILCADWAYALSPRRITVSTIGILPTLEKFIDSCECNLALSLHSPFDSERSQIIPANKTHSIVDILALLRRKKFSGQRQLLIEYIMLKNVNDNIRNAIDLEKLFRDLPCKVNLIRYNPIPDSPYTTSPEEVILEFESYLRKSGIVTTVRRSRGRDIMAACGMLSTIVKD